MKPPFQSLVFTILIIFAATFWSGCDSLKPKPGTAMSPQTVQAATSLLASGVIIATKDPEQRQKTANYLYSAALGVRTLSGTADMPSEQKFYDTLTGFLGAKPEYVGLARSLVSLYLGAYRDPATPKSELLESIALGLENAAAPFVDEK